MNEEDSDEESYAEIKSESEQAPKKKTNGYEDIKSRINSIRPVVGEQDAALKRKQRFMKAAME